jgi:hypothetical protein
MFVRNARQLRNGLNRADDIVCRHNRNHFGMLLQRSAEHLRVYNAVTPNGQIADGYTMPFEISADFQNGRVLEGTCNQVHRPRHGSLNNPYESHVICLGAACGEYDVTGVGAEKRSDSLPRLFDRGTCSTSFLVQTGRITEDSTQEGLHFSDHA